MIRLRLGLALALAAASLTACAQATAPAVARAVPDATPVASASAFNGYDPTRDPQTDIAAALATAATSHQQVLLDFGANWCPDCRSLDALFATAPLKQMISRDYLVVPIDVGQFDHNLDLAARYVNLQTSGIPALVVLTPTGKIRVATNDGAFENARTMTSHQVSVFLTDWLPASAG
jgi:thiol:disulfide interchange protein